jgi:hypothetical protein
MNNSNIALIFFQILFCITATVYLITVIRSKWVKRKNGFEISVESRLTNILIVTTDIHEMAKRIDERVVATMLNLGIDPFSKSDYISEASVKRRRRRVNKSPVLPGLEKGIESLNEQKNNTDGTNDKKSL